LDDLFVTGKTFARIRGEFEVFAGLRSVGRNLQARFGKARCFTGSLLRAGGDLPHTETSIGEAMKKKVLFICVQNSARSQIAAALLNEMCGNYFEAHSAGLNPGVLNPLAVDALKELGIDISGNKTQAVFDLWKSASHIFTYVITVCSESEAAGCPIFPGVTTRLYWSFPDPGKFTGTYEERLRQTRNMIEQIRTKIGHLCEEHCASEVTK
jgi:arsenate reductase (thioredoxin)